MISHYKKMAKFKNEFLKMFLRSTIFWPLLRRTFVIIKNSEMSNRQQLLRKIFEMEAKNESMMELMFFLALQHLEETIIMASRLQRQQQ